MANANVTEVGKKQREPEELSVEWRMIQYDIFEKKERSGNFVEKKAGIRSFKKIRRCVSNGLSQRET